MHGNIINKNKVKLFNTANSDLAARILILENNVYKITYYEIISGANGTLTVPTAATINANEFSGANCILSEIDVNNKPTWISPKDAGGTVVTASLNTGTGAWVKSGVTVSANVALIYSLNIRAADYANLTNFYIVEETVIGDFSYVLNNTTIGTVASSLLANAMSDETGSGSLVFGTSPTFTTDITTPLIIGGSAVGSNITYKSTSGTGTTTAAAHTFTGGTNGGTTIATLYNNGNFSIGNYASPNNLRLVTIGQDTAFMSFGSAVGATSAVGLYANQATPSSTNHFFYGTSTTSQLNTPSGGTLYLTYSGASLIGITNAGADFVFSARVAGAAAVTPYSFTVPANTGQTATEIPNFKVTGNTKTWAAGTITTQRWNYLTANTAAFASASTISESFGLYVEAATAGSNATITNNFALGLIAGTATLKFGNVTGSTTSWAIYANQATPNAANYILAGTNNDTELNSGSSTGRIFQRIGGNTVFTLGSDRFIATGGITQSSGAITNFTFSAPSNTGQTASTEINGYLYNSYSRQWATGNITTQRERWYKTVTYTAVAASTITTAYGAYFEAPTASTNITITNNYAAGFEGNVYVKSVGSNKYYLAEDTLGKQVIMGADGGGGYVGTKTNHDLRFFINFGTPTSLTIKGTTGYLDVTDNIHFSFQTTNGTKFGTATNQKIGFWNATPIVQPTTGVAAATLVGGGGTTLTDTDTFDGYTLKQIVKALRNTGLLA